MTKFTATHAARMYMADSGEFTLAGLVKNRGYSKPTTEDPQAKQTLYVNEGDQVEVAVSRPKPNMLLVKVKIVDMLDGHTTVCALSDAFEYVEVHLRLEGFEVC